MPNKYYIAIPAYNEEQAIANCLGSIDRASRFAGLKFILETTFICLNGCTDNTEAVVKKFVQNLPELKIKILYSAKGMNRALNKIMNSLLDDSLPIIQIDADTIAEEKSFLVLLMELEKHSRLQIVGGYPQALNYQGKNLYKKFLGKVLDVRSRWPYSQIAVNDVLEFHKVVNTDPQPGTSPEFERKSRIYFHGRFYALRNKKIWDVPANRIGDDTYLTLSVYKRFGPNCIRIRYDAICYYQPTTSLIQHWKIYKRIHYDVKMLVGLSTFQGLKKIKSLEKVKLNWSYIYTLALKVQFYFLCYFVIKAIEEILFKLFPGYSKKLWLYKQKID